MRVKRGVKARRRRKRILKVASGFRGRSKNTIRTATHRAEKSLTHMYRGRRLRKRDFRSLWITRISAAARSNSLSYSEFLFGLEKAGVELNRKMLAELGEADPNAFSAVAQVARRALAR